MSGNSEFGIRDSGNRSRKSPAGADPAHSDVSAIAPANAAPSEAAKGHAPAAGQGGRADEKRRQEVFTEVTKLEPEWRELVEKLIEEGSTLEDVAEILEERQGPRVTMHALGVHYQSSLDLQMRRIKYRIELADKLKHSLAHPETTEGRLADATLMTGLMRLTRGQSQLTIKDAQSLRMQRENLRLRQRILKMKQAEAVRKKSEAHQRYLYEEARRQKLTLQNQELMEILKKLRQDQTLPADVMGKIQEIYGIVKEPYISPKLAEMLPQSETP